MVFSMHASSVKTSSKDRAAKNLGANSYADKYKMKMEEDEKREKVGAATGSTISARRYLSPC